MIEFVDNLLAIIISFFSILLCVELLLGIYFIRKLQEQGDVNNLEDVADSGLLKNVVLIPAHNESDVIADTLISLKSELSPLDKIVVVADNCSDTTIDICKELGVIVVERLSTDKLGKGYALDFGVKWSLENLEFDSLVIFDADCKFKQGSFLSLVTQTNFTGKIHQASYLMKAANDDPKRKVSEFTWWIKNAIRATGLNLLNVGCHIQGSGVAFPKHTLSSVDFASGSIVEDLELGLNLSINKNDVVYYPSSQVESYFPSNDKGLEQQRQRWEHGHLDTVLKMPFFMGSAIKNRSLKAAILVADAAIPPLFAYIILLVLAFFVGLIFSFNESYTLMTAGINSLLSLAVLLILAWLIRGYHILQVSDIVGIARFLKDKVKVYVSFLTKKQTTWVRTTRDDKKDDKD